MRSMKLAIVIGLIGCLALMGCGSKEKKNLVGTSGSAASAAKAQVAGTQTETATVQGLSALQAVFQALNGQEKTSSAIALAPSNQKLTVTHTYNWKKDASGYYVNTSKDHRDSTFTFKMKQDPDWWDYNWANGNPWAGKSAGDIVTQTFTTNIEYNAPLDSIKSTGVEITRQSAPLVSGGSYYDYYTGQTVWMVYPDFSKSTITTEGTGKTENSKDATWMTYGHKGTAEFKMTYEDIKEKQTDPYGYTYETYVGGKWTWVTKNIEKMTFTMSTGYTGEFDVTASASFSGGWGIKVTGSTFTEDLKIVTDGKILKDGERVATIHVEARNVVNGMRVEGYYTIPEESDIIKHELDNSKYGFLSKEMFKEKQGSKGGSTGGGY